MVGPSPPPRRAPTPGRSSRSAVDVVDADPFGDDVAAAHRAYVAELATRFPVGFDPGDPRAELARYAPPDGACVLAVVDGDVVGTAALAPLTPRDDADEVALPLGEVKRMWVAPTSRGLGIGRLLLRAVEDRARAIGYATLRLDTNEVLTAAIGLYTDAGYRAVRRYNDNPYATHFFERRLD